MLTEPRLKLLKPDTISARAKRAAVEAMFGGMYPAAIHVSAVKTRLPRKPFDRFRLRCNRPSEEWSRGELEMLGAFVSSRNGCVF